MRAPLLLTALALSVVGLSSCRSDKPTGATAPTTPVKSAMPSPSAVASTTAPVESETTSPSAVASTTAPVESETTSPSPLNPQPVADSDKSCDARLPLATVDQLVGHNFDSIVSEPYSPYTCIYQTHDQVGLYVIWDARPAGLTLFTSNSTSTQFSQIAGLGDAAQFQAPNGGDFATLEARYGSVIIRVQDVESKGPIADERALERVLRKAATV